MENFSKIFYLQKENGLILYFYDKITALYSFSLKEHLKDQIKDMKIKNIWIDLSKCTYMDSTTIGALLQIHNVLERNQGCLYLCNLNDNINKIFQNAHLNTYLHLEVNTELAGLEKHFIEVMPLREKEELSDEFILDTHHDLVKIVPELAGEFESLFKILEQNIKNK